MSDSNKDSLDFPKLDWSFLDGQEDIIASPPPRRGSVTDASMDWPTLSLEDDPLADLEHNIMQSLKKEKAYDLSSRTSPLAVVIARNIAKGCDPGDELSFFYSDKKVHEDFHLYAKESRLKVLFDGIAPDGKGFLFAFVVPEKVKGINFF